MDKLKHFGACFAITLVFGALITVHSGVLLAVTAGVGKELRDYLRGGVFDWLDIAADAAGAGLAVAVFAIPTL